MEAKSGDWITEKEDIKTEKILPTLLYLQRDNRDAKGEKERKHPAPSSQCSDYLFRILLLYSSLHIG